MSAGIKRREGIIEFAAILGLLLPLTPLSPCLAQEWPSRPLTLVVPFTAGGGTDISARLQAQAIGDILGQTVIIENIGGGAGMTAGVRVARASPDGYTFIIGNTGTHAYNQSLYKSPLYNAVTDFAPGVAAHRQCPQQPAGQRAQRIRRLAQGQ
jgi:tripartite-type tricarboxylate transporter receptor subunit TctC